MADSLVFLLQWLSHFKWSFTWVRVIYIFLLGYIYHTFLMNSIKAQSPFFLPNLTGIVLYAPALALSAVTGLHFEGAVIGIGDISSYIMSLLNIMILNVSK